jgi:hypothetical protein
MTERREELREEFSNEDVVRVPENEDGSDEVRPEGQSQADVAAILADEDAGGFRSRWNEIQVRFVDEPRGSVEKADGLVAEMTGRLTKMFSEERTRLEGQWERGDDVSTEDLRIALQRYRSFFDRLLSA